jgi:hypothetical protein
MKRGRPRAATLLPIAMQDSLPPHLGDRPEGVSASRSLKRRSPQLAALLIVQTCLRATL